MDLQAKINEKFAELIEEGYVDKIVKEALQSTVKDIVQSSVRSYSSFGKELEKHIQDGMAVNLSRLSLAHYNDVVLRIVQEELDSTVAESATALIKERVQKSLGMLEKQNWKLSEIISKFKESLYGEHEEELGFHVEESQYGGGHHIYFDEHSKEDGGLYSSSRKTKAYHKFDYKMHLDKEGKIYNFSIDGARPDFTKETSNGFDSFFFKLYAFDAIVEVDEDECEISWEEDYD